MKRFFLIVVLLLSIAAAQDALVPPGCVQEPGRLVCDQTSSLENVGIEYRSNAVCFFDEFEEVGCNATAAFTEQVQARICKAVIPYSGDDVDYDNINLESDCTTKTFRAGQTFEIITRSELLDNCREDDEFLMEHCAVKGKQFRADIELSTEPLTVLVLGEVPAATIAETVSGVNPALQLGIIAAFVLALYVLSKAWKKKR